MDFPTVAEQRVQGNELNKYAKQQEALLHVSILLNSADDFIKKLSQTLSIIGDAMGVSSVYVFEDLEKEKVGNLVCEWQFPQAKPLVPYFTRISYDATPSWKTLLAQDGNIAASDIGTLPEDIKYLIKEQGIKSMLVMPLYLNGRIGGFIGVDDCKEYRVWENSDLAFISIISNIISYTFERHYAAKELAITLENQHHTNQELVRQNNDLQQFTYIVSHNLRAPIANLLGLVSLFRPQEPTHEVNILSMDNIKIVSYQLDKIVRDLNEIVEIKQYLTAETKENVYLEEEMRDILTNLERQIYTTQAQIDIDFTKISHIFTIRAYLNSILLHLLSNALKYKHPDRNPIISINDEILDDFICLTIKDNGLGIDLKKNAKKIFGFHKRFHSHVGGRGIGLYLVKLQTEALGGWIEVESQPEQGSIFKVYLPK